MLETCRGGPKSVSFRIEKTQNFDQVLPLNTAVLKAKLGQIFDRPFSPN